MSNILSELSAGVLVLKLNRAPVRLSSYPRVWLKRLAERVRRCPLFRAKIASGKRRSRSSSPLHRPDIKL